MARPKWGLRKGFRSGLEDKIAEQFRSKGRGDGEYEQHKLRYTTPPTEHKYTPDFKLRDGVFLETKGYFTPEDRKKHLFIRESNPGIEVRFVFSRSAAPIRKGSKTTYADWCRKHGFLFADKLIPEEWFKE